VWTELGFVSSSSPNHPCLLSPQSSPLKNSELDDRQSVKLRIADEKRKTGCLRRKLGGWLRKKRSKNERRRQNRSGRRKKNSGKNLRRPKRSTQDKKKARLEKRKAVEMEESGEETEKEPEGSNKKVMRKKKGKKMVGRKTEIRRWRGWRRNKWEKYCN
jgi:hypothetical protein